VIEMVLRIRRGKIPSKKGTKKFTFKGKPQYTITDNGKRAMLHGKSVGFFSSIPKARKTLKKIQIQRKR